MKPKDRFVVGSLIIAAMAVSCAFRGEKQGAGSPGQAQVAPEKQQFISSLGKVKPGIIDKNAQNFQGKQATAKVSTVASLILLAGTNVTIAVEENDLADFNQKKAASGLPLFFQWRKNRVPLVGETNTSLTLNGVTTADVASYTLLTSGAVETETAPVHISVYTPTTNSTGGVLTAPIGDFTIADNSISCGGTKVFKRFKVYTPFDGPNCTVISSDFPNPENHTKLTIETCFSANGTTLDTGILVEQNSSGMPDKCCNDTAGCPLNGNLARCDTINLTSNMKYRATIYAKALGTLSTISWSWRFHDDP